MGLDDIRVLPSCPIDNDRFCDFEDENICGYTTNIVTNSFDWERSSKSIMSEFPNDQ